MDELKEQNKTELVMVVGSRRADDGDEKVERKWHRKFVAFVFKIVITLLLGIKAKDTQCGFKLFTK